MPAYQMIVLTNAVPGRDDEFNRWYDEIHLADVLKVEGVRSARRFRAVDSGAWRYTAIYDLDCEDPNGVMEEIVRRWQSGEMRVSEAFDASSFIMTVVEPIDSSAATS